MILNLLNFRLQSAAKQEFWQIKSNSFGDFLLVTRFDRLTANAAMTDSEVAAQTIKMLILESNSVEVGQDERWEFTRLFLCLIGQPFLSSSFSTKQLKVSSSGAFLGSSHESHNPFLFSLNSTDWWNFCLVHRYSRIFQKAAFFWAFH